MSSTAVIFETFVFDPVVERRYERLRANLPPGGQLFLLAEAGTPIPDMFWPETHFFDFARLRERARSTVARRVVPGSPHLAAIDFFEAHPGFDRYWFIEYDVVLSGRWRALFDAFADDPADLLATHIETPRENPRWPWWPSVESPFGRPSDLRKAFLPVHRLSNGALRTLARAVDAGWTGHFEGLVPTVLAQEGLTVGDLAGFYDAASVSHRPLPSNLRVRPGFLYHPVKPPSLTRGWRGFVRRLKAFWA